MLEVVRCRSACSHASRFIVRKGFRNALWLWEYFGIRGGISAAGMHLSLDQRIRQESRKESGKVARVGWGDVGWCPEAIRGGVFCPSFVSISMEWGKGGRTPESMDMCGGPWRIGGLYCGWYILLSLGLESVVERRELPRSWVCDLVIVEWTLGVSFGRHRWSVDPYLKEGWEFDYPPEGTQQTSPVSTRITSSSCPHIWAPNFGGV